MTFTQEIKQAIEKMFAAKFTAEGDGGKTLLKLDGKTVFILGN